MTLSHDRLEVWALPSEWEEYIAHIRNTLSVDFDQLSADGEDVSIPVELKQTGIRPITENLSIELDLSPYTNKTVNVPLSEENVYILNCPEGYNVTVESGTLFDVIVCGGYSELKKLDPAQLRVVIDVAGLTAGQNVGHVEAKVRIESDSDTLWTCYKDGDYKVGINITQE